MYDLIIAQHFHQSMQYNAIPLNSTARFIIDFCCLLCACYLFFIVQFFYLHHRKLLTLAALLLFLRCFCVLLFIFAILNLRFARFVRASSVWYTDVLYPFESIMCTLHYLHLGHYKITHSSLLHF